MPPCEKAVPSGKTVSALWETCAWPVVKLRLSTGCVQVFRGAAFSYQLNARSGRTACRLLTIAGSGSCQAVRRGASIGILHFSAKKCRPSYFPSQLFSWTFRYISTAEFRPSNRRFSSYLFSLGALLTNKLVHGTVSGLLFLRRGCLKRQ